MVTIKAHHFEHGQLVLVEDVVELPDMIAAAKYMKELIGKHRPLSGRHLEQGYWWVRDAGKLMRFTIENRGIEQEPLDFTNGGSPGVRLVAKPQGKTR